MNKKTTKGQTMKNFLESYFSNFKIVRKHLGGFWFKDGRNGWYKLPNFLLEHVDSYHKEYTHEDYR